MEIHNPYQQISDVLTDVRTRIDVMSGEIQRITAKLSNRPLLVSHSEEYVTKKEAAQIGRCSVSTIDNYRRSGTLKRYMMGGLVRFKKEDVLNLFKAK